MLHRGEGYVGAYLFKEGSGIRLTHKGIKGGGSLSLALGDPWPTLTFCKSLLHYEEVFGKEFVLIELVFDILVDLFLCQVSGLFFPVVKYIFCYY